VPENQGRAALDDEQDLQISSWPGVLNSHLCQRVIVPLVVLLSMQLRVLWNLMIVEQLAGAEPSIIDPAT
jgi:hypothetical protein